ncbi:MAG: c-type cytochrome [Paracoccaceae bacterium]|nr:c-type cytochrome [Paracoccaceae bacterium]
MSKLTLLSFVLVIFGPASFADDAVTRGEKIFKKCISCHAVITPDGDILRRGGRAGPNLYAVIGRPAASTEFRYSKALKAAGAAGLIWSPETLADFVKDPSAYLKVQSGNKKARSKMSYRLKKGAADVAAYLETITE